jgi:hypothetical protein
MCSSVDHCPKGHRVGDLTVEPDVLIGGEEPGEPWSEYANEVPQHWEEDEAAIESEDEPRTSRGPNGILQGVEARKYGVDFLWKRRLIVGLRLQRRQMGAHL